MADAGLLERVLANLIDNAHAICARLRGPGQRGTVRAGPD